MVESLITHSTTDPDLPSYEHRVLVAIREELERNRDCWDYLRDKEETYLPREQQEPWSAYRDRLNRTSYVSFFRDAITAFSGVLSRFELADPPSSLEAAEQDIDLRGNSLKAFLMAADCMAMRDGGVLLCVDMPAGTVETNGDVIEQDRRPYLSLCERSNVLNWRTHFKDGHEVLDWVILREWVEIPEGRFGMTWEPRYRLIGTENGQAFWQVFKIIEQGRNANEVVIVDQGQYFGPSGRPYEDPPVVWYAGGQQTGFGQGAIKLSALACLTLEHYRSRSDHNELARKTCMPVPVRVGAVVGPGGKPPPLVIGPNSVVDLEGSGDFRFAEPSADSLSHLSANIQHIEALIQGQTLAFMYGDGGSQQKTATQSALEAAQTEATIKTISQSKTSAVQRLIELWGDFTGEPISDDTGITMQPNVFDRPLESGDVAQLGQMEQNEQISKRSYLEQIIKGGILTVVASADEELERLDEEAPDAEEMQADMLRNQAALTGEVEDLPELAFADSRQGKEARKNGRALDSGKGKSDEEKPKKTGGKSSERDS